MAHGLGEAETSVELIDVPGCELETLVGRGGMGAVYLARQVNLDREVAVKVLASALADDPLFLERLEREARTMARLRHPNIVTVHDFQKLDDGSAAIIMQYIEGGSLRQVLARHPQGLPVAEALGIIRQVASGLSAAHAAGIVHRDMKPENVLIERDGTACVSDFGLALPLHDETTRLTITGTTVGTLDYMAPEQLRGQTVDARGDIYALGVMLYELLTGQTPRGSFEPPHRLRRDVSESVSLVTMRALRPQAADRFGSMEEFMLALDLPPRKKRPLLWLSFAAVLAIASTIGALNWPTQPTVVTPVLTEQHGPWRDALAGVRIYEDVLGGEWTNNKGILTSNHQTGGLVLEKEMPPAYDVRMRFTRLSGVHSVALFFKVNGMLVCCDIDAWSEGLAGVQLIDGQSLMDGYGFRFPLTNGRSYEMLLEVRPDEVRVNVNGEITKTFDIKGKKLAVPEPWMWSIQGRRIGLGIGSYESPTRFEKVEWRAVELVTAP